MVINCQTPFVLCNAFLYIFFITLFFTTYDRITEKKSQRKRKHTFEEEEEEDRKKNQEAPKETR